MTENNTTATLHAVLSYRDAPAALRWLEKAFGFETTMEFADDQGGIMHAEVRYGTGVAFTVFTDEAGYERPARKGETAGWGLYVAVASKMTVDAVHASAVAAGAESIWAPGDTEWGNYRCRVVDPEGYEWTFGTHVPGQPQVW
ncbi:glyoxalase [Kribbella sp. ALI-6-A]|uniref:VOC family protein n=1 Tax=Kribbella sp. ALI-6-A TaxID=1933817 RepID=UPI00097C4ADF|nr:VOC family protein [Kribbella sp. ALI-6-A]ONI68300.1 glyoxalase [Kribbella sp. ALI-6-A]